MRKKKNPVKLYSNMSAEFAGLPPIDPKPKSYNIFKDSLMRLLYSNFKWYGLEEYEANMIERMLISTGRVCGLRTNFDIETQTPDNIFFGYYGTDVDNVEYDFYGRSTKASVSGFNGKVYRAETPNDFVVGFDSTCYYFYNVGIPPIETYVRYLAEELNQAYETLKVAAETRKSGIVFQCQTQRSKQLLEQILKNRSLNSPYIVVTSNLGEETETLFRPPNSSDLTEYYTYFINTWGIVLDILGLENNGNSKRERLIVNESVQNQSLARYIGGDRLQARKRFAKELNNKFGMNVRVENYLSSLVVESPNNANIYGEESENNVDKQL